MLQQSKGHAPKRPPEDTRRGELYMRLAGGKRLRKVRNTIYQDPGNPFAVDNPSASSQEQFGSPWRGDVPDYNGADHWKPQVGSRFQDVPLDVSEEYSDSSEPWDIPSTRDAGTISEDSRNSPQSIPFVYAPMPQHAKSMEPQHGDRRSLSVDIALLPSWTDSMPDTDDVYELTSRDWRSDSLPSLHAQTSSEATLKANRRDAGFYAFYDDLLAEYGIGFSHRWWSGSTLESTAAYNNPLPIANGSHNKRVYDVNDLQRRFQQCSLLSCDCKDRCDSLFAHKEARSFEHSNKAFVTMEQRVKEHNAHPRYTFISLVLAQCSRQSQSLTPVFSKGDHHRRVAVRLLSAPNLLKVTCALEPYLGEYAVRCPMLW